MTRHWKKFAIALALPLLLGSGCDRLMASLTRGSGGGGPVSCDFAGKTYMKGESHAADDGCNACTCGERGWECTRFRCPASAQGAHGTIEGALSSADGSFPSLRVCAADFLFDNTYCTQTTTGAKDFSLQVPVGKYWVYATRADGPASQRAFDTRYVRCGMKSDCKDHSPVQVTVKDGSSAEADPEDWYAGGVIDDMTIAPSRREDGSFFYMDDSIFDIRGRNLTSVDVIYIPYPKGETEPTVTLGRATRSGSEGGEEIWTMPVPKDFEASRVYAVGHDKDGAFMRGTGLSWIRSANVLHLDDSTDKMF